MDYAQEIRIICVFGPILGLLLVGLLVSLGSGVASLASRNGLHLFLSNFSLVVLRVFGYIAGLLIIQQFVGFPIKLLWS